MVKNFLPETLTLPGQPTKWPSAPRLLICCLSQSLSHPVKYTLHNIYSHLLIDFKGVREPVNRVPQKKTEKRKPIPQGRREGMSGFLLKILPDEGGWRFLIKPGGLELDRPGRRLTFAFLFWFFVLFSRRNACF
jgi:hypothetical protein